MLTDGPRVSLSFTMEDQAQEHRVDAEVLAQALLHAQRAVHLLAMTAAGREFKERLRVPSDLADEFKLVCQPPTAGSYVQEVVISGTGAVLDMPSREGVLTTFSDVGAALSNGSWDSLRELVPDSATRQRVVDEYVALLPAPESGYGLDMIRQGTAYASFRRPQILAVHEYSRKTREPRAFATAPVTVVGELVSIDFGAHMISIRHYPSDRRINCEYTEDAEDMLIKNRRGLIQVTGMLERDKRDRPVRMTDVFDIKELDLSPISVQTVEGQAIRLRFRQGTYYFNPALDLEGELVVDDPVLDVHAYAASRAGLIKEVFEQIEFLWLEYVRTEEPLTRGASVLAERLKEMLEPMNDEE